MSVSTRSRGKHANVKTLTKYPLSSEFYSEALASGLLFIDDEGHLKFNPSFLLDITANPIVPFSASHPLTVTVENIMPTLEQINVNQAGAVQNTWYPVCDLTNVELLMTNFACTVANETIEVRMVIDGVTYTATQAAVFNTDYSARLNADYTGAYGDIGAGIMLINSATIKCERAVFSIRKTTAGGASALRCNVLYQQW